MLAQEEVMLAHDKVMLSQEEVMLALRRWCEVWSKVKSERGKWNLGRYNCLLHFLDDSGSGVSVDQFAVATCKSHLSTNLEHNRLTLKFKLLILL